MTPAEIVRIQMDMLLKGAHVPDLEELRGEPPDERTVEKDIDDAKRFRDCLGKRCPTNICAVCSCYRCPKEIREVLLSKKGLHLHLLAADLPSTPQLPRHAKTIYRYKGKDYCLQKAGIREGTEETAARVGKDKGLKVAVGEPYATICDNCLTSLENENVPAASLVRLDPGEIPVAENSEEQLLPLTMLEANLLAMNRVMRLCYIIRPWGNADTIQKQQRGHVIAFEHV